MPNREDKTGYWYRFIRAVKHAFNPKPAPPPPPGPVGPPAGVTMYRIKTDPESPYWGGMSRTNWANPTRWRKTHQRMAQAPQTVRVNLQRSNGKRGPSDFNYPIEWQEFVRMTNTPRAFHYLTRTASGWVNRPEWPRVQCLLFRDNVIPITKIDGKRAYIAHHDLNAPPPTPCNWMQRFTVIREDGATIMPDPPGEAAWMPLAFPMDVWIDAEEITPWTP
jgi:hypothetical protein